jgi:hypothetical protein
MPKVNRRRRVILSSDSSGDERNDTTCSRIKKRGGLVITEQLGVVQISSLLFDRLIWYDDGWSTFDKLDRFEDLIKTVIDQSDSRDTISNDEIEEFYPELFGLEGVTHFKFKKCFHGKDRLSVRKRVRDHQVVQPGVPFCGNVDEGCRASFLATIIVSVNEKGDKLISKIGTSSRFWMSAAQGEMNGEVTKEYSF